MKHLLLDVNVVVDLSVQRSGTANAEIALSLAEYAGISIWVYAGSVQTLEYVTASELRALLASTGITLSRTEAQRRARELLGAVTANYSWLAALAAMAGRCSPMTRPWPRPSAPSALTAAPGVITTPCWA